MTPCFFYFKDEFGKGTTPVDGIALLATTIRHFTKTKAKVRTSDSILQNKSVTYVSYVILHIALL